MKPSTYQSRGHERLTSSNASDTQTASIPRGTSAIEITVETTACRVTFDGSDPAGGIGLIVQAAQNPWFLPVGQGIVLKVVSTGATTSVAQIAYLQ